MVKYEIDDKNFMTGNWCTIGSFEKFIECEETQVDLNKRWNGSSWEIGTNPKVTRQKLDKEMQELKTWLDTYYAQHEQKYRRLHTLGLKCDNGSDPYNELLKLYAEAEQKRKRIQEIEELVK